MSNKVGSTYGVVVGSVPINLGAMALMKERGSSQSGSKPRFPASFTCAVASDRTTNPIVSAIVEATTAPPNRTSGDFNRRE